MKIALTTLLLTACFLSMPVSATEYIYRDVMANTLPGAKCEVQSSAAETAKKNYNIDRFSKKFCQFQGYGWHVEQVKDLGKTVCTECGYPKGLQKCHQEDVVVSCKRIKPGSVGMLPGKS
ncbi:MAG: hypothetical protein ACXV7J_12410 [Methylomonas sp.]